MEAWRYRWAPCPELSEECLAGATGVRCAARGSAALPHCICIALACVPLLLPGSCLAAQSLDGGGKKEAPGTFWLAPR
jgi:hypothetical protein